MATLPYTGVDKIDRALTGAWKARLSIRIQSRPLNPLWPGHEAGTQWSVMIRRPDRAPGTALSVYDASVYAHLFWHTRGRHTRFSGGKVYDWGNARGKEVRTGRDLDSAIFHVSIGVR